MKIGILGPEGTFSESAAISWLTGSSTGRIEDTHITYYETISDVAESLVRREVDYGIVPIENSLEGSVGETLDLLSSEDNEPGIRIVGELLMPIQICLLAKGPFERIKKVVSHPHALAQCKQFLKQMRTKGVEVKSVDSTAAAAKMAMEDEEVAALASKEAAKRYQLTTLAVNVQDRESVTRFVILSSRDTRSEPTGRDKTSLLIYLRDRPGALYEVLGEFAQRNINLTKIESRPSKRALGDYMFHIDCEGHVEDHEIREALEGVRRKVARLTILGAYPKAR